MAVDKHVITFNEGTSVTIFVFNADYLFEHDLIEIGDATKKPTKEMLD